MTFEEVLDTKEIRITGWLSVIMMATLHAIRFMPNFNITIHDFFLVLSSIAGSVYLILKAIIAYYTALEKKMEYDKKKSALDKKRKRLKSLFRRKVKQKDDIQDTPGAS